MCIVAPMKDRAPGNHCLWCGCKVVASGRVVAIGECAWNPLGSSHRLVEVSREEIEEAAVGLVQVMVQLREMGGVK